LISEKEKEQYREQFYNSNMNHHFDAKAFSVVNNRMASDHIIQYQQHKLMMNKLSQNNHLLDQRNFLLNSTPQFH
jgi:hypothetical protein